jgi:integrase
MYATAVYAGLRAGELAALEWSDVDFDRRLVTVQRSFSGPTKSDKVRYVPILDALLLLLREWRMRHPGVLVFTNRDGNMHRESGRIFQEVLHRVLDRAGFPRMTRADKVRSYMVFHGLRHTFASHWVMKGGDIFKLQRILRHQSIQMTMRYAHLAPDAFVADYGRFSQALRSAAACHDEGIASGGVAFPPRSGARARRRMDGTRNGHELERRTSHGLPHSGHFVLQLPPPCR